MCEKNKFPLGIFAWFGYNLSITESFHKILDAGFERVMLWWGEYEGDLPLSEQVKRARQLGLEIENAHAPYDGANDLWKRNESGILYAEKLLSCLQGCYEQHVPTLVVHLSDGMQPPEPSKIGLERLKKVVETAEKFQIRLAFENLKDIPQLEAVMKTFSSYQYTGFCYDSGHHHCCNQNYPYLEKYGHKLFALHLHDNDGTRDSHRLPFDGNTQWEYICGKIIKVGYVGGVSLEVQAFQNYEEKMNAESFIQKAHSSGEKIQKMMIEQYRKKETEL